MFSKVFSENRTVCEIMSKNMETEGPHMTSQYGAYALHAALIRLHVRKHTPASVHTHTHTHTHRNMQHLLLYNGNNGFVNASERYVIRTLLSC